MEADAIKSKDVVYQQLRLRMAADSSLDAYVHEYSTAAAELMLVTAINQQKVSALAGLQYKTAAAVLAMVVIQHQDSRSSVLPVRAVRPSLTAVLLDFAVMAAAACWTYSLLRLALLLRCWTAAAAGCATLAAFGGSCVCKSHVLAHTPLLLYCRPSGCGQMTCSLECLHSGWAAQLLPCRTMPLMAVGASHTCILQGPLSPPLVLPCRILCLMAP